MFLKKRSRQKLIPSQRYACFKQWSVCFNKVVRIKTSYLEYINPISMIKVPLHRSWFKLFLVQKFSKNLHILCKFFKKTRKNIDLDMIYCEFSKKFYAKLFPINFYVPLCPYLETRKNFFHQFLEVFWTEKKFSIFFRKTAGIIQKLFFNHF